MRRLPILAAAALVLGAAAAALLLHATGSPPPVAAPRPECARAIGQDASVLAARRATPSVARVTVLRAGSGTLGPVPTARVTGSGFVADSRGVVVTSARLVAGAARIAVRLPQARIDLPVTAVHVDAPRGVALLRVRSAAPLRALVLADPPPVGGHVLALGAGGLSLGVVSGRQRGVLLAGQPARGLLQSDAAVNPGNLGGPLVDLDGRAVAMTAQGINTVRGMSFAVPVRPLVAEIHRMLAVPQGNRAAKAAPRSGPWHENGPFGLSSAKRDTIYCSSVFDQCWWIAGAGGPRRGGTKDC